MLFLFILSLSAAYVLASLKPSNIVGRVYPSDRAINLENGVFMSATYTDKGMLLLGGCPCGNVLGKDGEGLLAKITFGYLSEEY